MKSIVMALVAFASIAASAKTVWITEEVCPTNVRGRDGIGDMYYSNPRAYCYTVTFKYRGPSQPSTGPTCHNMGSNIDVDYSTGIPLFPCPPKHYGVPGWLRSLNDAMIRAGFRPHTQEELEKILNPRGDRGD